MPRPLAPLAAVLVSSWLAAAPVHAQSLYTDWLSGWNAGAQATGDALRIGIDPETGTWGLPVDRALRTSGIVAPPLVIHHPNGMIETYVDPSVVDWLVVRLDARGRPVLGCASSDVLHSAPAASGPPDR